MLYNKYPNKSKVCIECGHIVNIGEAEMLWMKVCPRCQGNLLLDRDIYGWYEQCLQCSHLRDVDAIVRVKEQYIEEAENIELVQLRE